MDVEAHPDLAVSRIAAAIGEPARSRMLFALMDGHARTGTELAAIAEVGPSTASVHLGRLLGERLVKVVVQGKHRYYSLEGSRVARVLEGLSVIAGAPRNKFVPSTPNRLRAARTCYDHIAGTLGVALHDRIKGMGWLVDASSSQENVYDLTSKGKTALEKLGIDVERTRSLRRRFACACLDWSERRSHLGGALGTVLLETALKKRWVAREADGRALDITNSGRKSLQAQFGIKM